MKLAVVCANGRVGKLVVKEAVERWLDVTAISREENQTVATKSVTKDLFDLIKKDLARYYVVSAFGAWEPELLPQHSTSLKHLCDILSGTDIRLCVLGGAGSLYKNAEHTMQVMDWPDFPDIFKPLAAAPGKALDELRERNDVKWTFLSPVGNFQAEGERTGEYILASE